MRKVAQIRRLADRLRKFLPDPGSFLFRHVPIPPGPCGYLVRDVSPSEWEQFEAARGTGAAKRARAFRDEWKAGHLRAVRDQPAAPDPVPTFEDVIEELVGNIRHSWAEAAHRPFSAYSTWEHLRLCPRGALPTRAELAYWHGDTWGAPVPPSGALPADAKITDARTNQAICEGWEWNIFELFPAEEVLSFELRARPYDFSGPPGALYRPVSVLARWGAAGSPGLEELETMADEELQALAEGRGVCP